MRNTIYYIRDAYYNDFQDIQTLMNKGYGPSRFFGEPKQNSDDQKDFFGHFTVHRMLVLESEKSTELIGYAEFQNFPNIDALPIDCWQNWLEHHYCTNLPLVTTSVLFLNYFVYSENHCPKVLETVLSELFFRESKVRFVITVQMPEETSKTGTEDEPQYFDLALYSEVFFPRVFDLITCRNVQRLHIIHRNNIIPKMTYREAHPEDNDEVVEVFDIERPDLREELGDFFIAEELLRPAGDDIFIVTEVDHETAGFIWLNGNVDIVKLAENFELDLFQNLIKCDFSERHSEKNIEINVTERKLFSKRFTIPKITKLWTAEAVDEKDMYSPSSEDEVNAACPCSVIMTEEEKEIFDIYEDYFKKYTLLDKELRSTQYYFNKYTKTLSIFYNLPEDYDESIEGPYPIDKYPNGFALQLWGLNDKYDIRRIFRFMMASFTTFPDRDYMLVSIPKGAKMTKCLVELLKYFILIIPRPDCKILDDIYLTHRSSIYGELSLHVIRMKDIVEIENMLLHGVMNFERLTYPSLGPRHVSPLQHEVDLVRRIAQDVLNNPFSDYKFMTIRCGNSSLPMDANQIVGFVILCKFAKIHLLENHFRMPNASEHVAPWRGEVVLLRLHPLHQFEADEVFREIARTTGFLEIFHIVPTRGQIKPLANDLACNMQPIEPKRIKKFIVDWPQQNPVLNTPPDFVDLFKDYNFADEYFAVYQQNLRPIAYFGNQNSIVIIGFTDITKAFLRTMVFSWNTADSRSSDMYCCVPFLKITVIADPGIVEAEYECEFHCRMRHDLEKHCWIYFQNSNAFLRDVVKRMDLREWVKFINGTVLEIDRSKHIVRLDNNCKVYYDILLLFCDTDFGLVKPLKAGHVLPPNYAHINTRLDKFLVYHKLQNIPPLRYNTIGSNSAWRIVVYGAHLLTYEFINFLVTHEIDPTWITLVVPYTTAEQDKLSTLNTPYADASIEEILEDMVEDMGVVVHKRLNFVHWLRYKGSSCLRKLLFKPFPDGKDVFIECDFFVSFHEANMDTHTANILNAANIEMNNNRILVNIHYQTNDHAIYAIGKYIEHRNLVNHQYRYVSAAESAEKIIHVLNLEVLETQKHEYKFAKPCYFQSRLPLSYNFVKITTPKRYLANHLPNKYSYPLVTYNGDFCRVRLNTFKIVEEIVCVTTKRVAFDFLQFFCGKHEALMNNLQARWCLNEIDSFLEFFQEPWTELLTNDYFYELQEANRELLMSVGEEALDWALNRVDRVAAFIKHLEEEGVDQELEAYFLDFLRKHQKDFMHKFAMPEDFPARASVDSATSFI